MSSADVALSIPTDDPNEENVLGDDGVDVAFVVLAVEVAVGNGDDPSGELFTLSSPSCSSADISSLSFTSELSFSLVPSKSLSKGLVQEVSPVNALA